MLAEILLTVLATTVLVVLFPIIQIRSEILFRKKEKQPSKQLDTSEVVAEEIFFDNDVDSSVEDKTLNNCVSNKTGQVSANKGPFYNSFPKASKSQAVSQNPKRFSRQTSSQKSKSYIKNELAYCSDTSVPLPIYNLKIKKAFENRKSQVRKYEFGRSKTGKYTMNERVIMILGATGSGKTTLINSMVNYILGVELDDPFRFKLIVEEDEVKKSQAFSQTSWITAYTIHYNKRFKVPYTLTIIDTPGYGDSSGIHRDMEITKQVRDFFSVSGHEGIDRIDAVGFVVQSSLPRLTPTQQYIFDQILFLFGKDIGENIYLMLTFADGKQPQVLSGIKQAGLIYQEYFKFNNSMIFEEIKGDDDFDKMFWKMGIKSFENFFHIFQNVKAKSLTQTKSVLDEREKIEVQIIGLQKEIKRGLSKLEQLKQEVEVVEQHKSELSRNENFEYTVIEDKVVKHDLKLGTYVTTCLICNFTCHNPCGIPNDEEKYGCAAMGGGSDPDCTVCPQKCNWKQHRNTPFYLTTEVTRVTKTSDDLKRRYLDANGKVLKATEIVKEMSEEFEAVQLKVIGITEVVRKSITKLNKIALKPTSLNTSEYIDILIQSEETAAQPGWQERVTRLSEVRDKVIALAKIAEKGFDPFIDYKKKIEADKEEKGIWSTVGGYLNKINFFGNDLVP